MQVFLPLLSSQSVNRRGYYQRELKLAIDTAEEIPEGQLFIIPLRLDDCQILSEKLSKYQYQNMFPDWSFAVNRIIEAIKLSISHLPSKDEIEFKPKIIDSSSIQSLEKLKIDLLSGSSISVTLSKILGHEIRQFLKPVDIVWLKNELYGYSITDEFNRKSYIQNDEILPGNPNYRNVKGEIRIMRENQLSIEGFKVVKFPLFLGQAVPDLERMSEKFERYQRIFNIPINSLSKEQLDAVKQLNPRLNELPVHLTKPEIDRCLSELRLRIHRLLSEV